MAIIAGFVLVAAIGSCVVLLLRMFRIAWRDAQDLAAKLAFPHPRRAADWPEARLGAVVADPDADDRFLLVARWPARPDATVLLECEAISSGPRVYELLERWRDADASLAPRRVADHIMTLRCRRTNDAITLHVIRETSVIGVGSTVIRL